MGRHTTRLGESSRAEKRPPLPYPVRDGRVPPPVQAAVDRRSKRRRSRLAAASAASVLALSGAAGVGMAMADEPESGGAGEIVFSGDCGTLGLVSATSTPSSTDMTVTEGTQVRYTNELGTSADLHVGDESYEIGSGSSQVFVMNQSAEVAMVPDCSRVLSDYGSAQVNVTAAEEAEETEETDQTETATGQLPSGSSDGDSGDDAGRSSADAGGQPSAGDEGARDDEPAGDDADEADTDESESESEADAEEEEMNSFGPHGGTDGGAGDEAFVSAGDEDEVVAVDPKAVADGASGLLALVAIVCLVGVSAAVMRTILRQKATA